MRGIYVYIKHNIDYFQIFVISLWRVLEIATRVVPGVNGKCLDMYDLHEAVGKKRNLPPLFIYYFTIKQHYDMENYCISSIAFIVLFIVQGFGWYNMHDTVSWIPDAQRYDTGQHNHCSCETDQKAFPRSIDQCMYSQVGHLQM